MGGLHTTRLVMPRASWRRTLLAYVRRKKWWARGHGNLHLSLESYTLARDGRYHLLDAYNQKQPTFLIELQARAQGGPGCCNASLLFGSCVGSSQVL